MNASHLGNCNGRHETLVQSQICGSHNELGYVCLDSLSPKSTGCSHFSIRGYVSKIRKHDWTICWPFHELHDHKNVEKHDLLPPMSVANFRWWDCQNCLSKLSPTETVTPDGSARKGLPCKVNVKGKSLDINPVSVSHATGLRFFPHSQVASGKAFGNGRPLETYGAHTFETDVQSQPLLFGSSGDQEFIKADTTNQEADEMQRMSISMSINEAIAHEQCKRREHVFPTRDITCVSKRKKAIMKRNMAPMQKKSDLEVPYKEIICQSVERQHEMLSKTLTKKKSERQLGLPFSGTSNYIPKAKNKKSNTGFKDETKLVESFKGKHLGLKKNNLIENKNLHQKKAQKTRMLNEIMEREVGGMSTGIPASLKESFIQLNGSNLKSDVLKEEVTDGECKLNVPLEKEKGKVPKRKRRHPPEHEDERYPLMHWLNRIPETVKHAKLDKKSRFIDSAVHSEPMDMVSSGKLLGCSSKVCRSNQGHNTLCTKGKKKNRMTQVEAGQQSLSSSNKNADARTSVVREGSEKHDPKIIHNKSTTDVLGKRTLHPQLNLNERPPKKGNMNDKQNKTTQNGDEQYPSIHAMKESLEISNDGGIGDPKSGQLAPEKVATKISNQMSDAADVDGIPVEILKLLQENWLKRHLTNAECSTQSIKEFPKMTKHMKEGKVQEFTSNNRDGASTGMLQNLPMQFPHPKPCGFGHEMPSTLNNSSGQCSQTYKFGNDAGFAGSLGESTSYKLHVDGSHVHNKCRNDSMIQHDIFHVATEFKEPSHLREQRCGLKHPFIESRGNFYPQNQRLVIQNVDSYKAGVISTQGPCRSYPFSQSSLPQSSIPIGMTDSHKHFSDLKYLSKSSQDALLRQRTRDMALELSVMQVANADATNLQARNASDAKSNKKTLHADNFPYFNEMNGYSKQMMPQLDLQKNDTFSAMHLLRLMDPAVCSSAPSSSLCSDQTLVYKPPKISCTNRHTEELYGTQSSERMNQQLIHEIECENHVQRYHPEKTFNSLLVPGSGFSESLLPKGNVLCSDGYRQPFSYSNCFHTEAQLFPIKDCAKEKQDIPCNASQGRATFQNSFSGDERMQENVLSFLNHESQSKISQRNEKLHLGKKKNAQVSRSADKNCQTEFCVLNRNPADFTVPEEGNEYMRSCDDLRPSGSFLCVNKVLPVYPNHQRKQKAMKLTALKGFLRN